MRVHVNRHDGTISHWHATASQQERKKASDDAPQPHPTPPTKSLGPAARRALVPLEVLAARQGSILGREELPAAHLLIFFLVLLVCVCICLLDDQDGYG